MSRTRFAVTVLFLIGALFSFILFSLARDWEDSRARARFAAKAEVHAQALHRAVRYNIEIVHSLRHFIEAVGEVSPEEFRAFTAPTLKRHRGVRTLSLIERGDEDRFRVTAIEPTAEYAASIGFDISAETALREPLLKAVENDTLIAAVIPAATMRADDPAAVVFFQPVRRRGVITGCATSACEVDRMMEATFANYETDALNLFLWVEEGPDSRIPVGATGPEIDDAPPSTIVWSGRFKAATHAWVITCRPSRAFLRESRGSAPWLIFAAGLLVSLVPAGLFARRLAAVRAVEDAERRHAEELARRDAILREELSLARTIQRALLPSGPPAATGLEIGLCFVPSGEVGGDYFDFIPLDDGRTAVILADISGHGVPAALLFAIFKALAGEVFRGVAATEETFRDLNRRLTKLFPKGRFASTFYAVFDPRRGTFTCLKASQEPGLVFRRRGGIECIEDGGPPLGALNPDVFGDPEYTSATIAFAPGDTLLLFTDGLVEVEDPRGRMLTVEGLVPWVEEELERTPQEMVDRIFARTIEYAGAKELRDDFTVIAVRMTEG
jgi:serine phosphatase RsbU (regulator of sigma subunit)